MESPENAPDLPDASVALAQGWECYVTRPRAALDLAAALLGRVGLLEPARDEARLLRGCALALLGEFAVARAELGAHPSIAEELPAAESSRRALLALGIAEFRAGETDRAFELWDRARRASQAQNDSRLEGNADIQCGIARIELGDFARAADHLFSALRRFENPPFPRGVAIARGNLGNLFFRLGDHDQAAEHFLAGLTVLEQLGDRRGRAVALASLGRIRLRYGSKEDGIEGITAAAREFESLGLVLEESIARLTLGEELLRLGRAAEAAPHLRAARAVAERSGASQQSTQALVVLAEACAANGELADAAAHFARAIAETKPPERRQLRAHTLLALARARSHASNREVWVGLPETIAALEEVLAAGPATEFGDCREAHELLAREHEARGDAVRALHHFKEFLRFARADAEERGKQAVARAEATLTVEQLRREHASAVAQTHRLEAALGEARREHDRAENANRAKSALLSIVAHDLRSPLTQIALSTELLALESINPQLQDELRRVNLTAHRAGRLIQSLLDGAAAEEGQLRVLLSDFDLSAVVARLTAQLAPLARAKGQRFLLETNQHVPVRTDTVRVEQIAQNLVDNAIKYSPHNTTIEVRTTTLGDWAHLVVTDHGPGMSADDLAHAFDRYTPRSARPTGNESSHGLGLAITRQIVEALGGTIKVDSDGAGCGCTFTVALPRPR